MSREGFEKRTDRLEYVRAGRDDDESENETAGRDQGLVTRMLATRTVLLAGEVDEKLAERTISQLLILNAASHEPIRVVVTSPGGLVDAGFAIHDMMRFVESRVVTLGAGWVASIAVPILLAADSADRYSLPNTRFLLHQPSGGAGGPASDMRIAAEAILRVRERINALVAHETGQSVEKVAADSDRNFWMSAEEAHDYGLVSRLVASADEIG